VKSVRDGDFRTDTFVASRVHDVAAAVYPYFERTTAQAGAVRIEVFSPRGYGAAARRQAKLAAAGLRYFSAAYGAYPYPQLSVVLPPRGASAASGMEYPTLFVSGGPWWCAPDGVPDPSHDPIAAHELAHQWFSGMIASNEVAVPMLDEGLAQWSSLDFLRAREPGLQRAPLDPFDMMAAAFLFRGQPVPSSLLPAHGFRHDTLARAVYLRPAIVLHEIERRYGRDKLRRALRHYADAERFRHPGIGEFFAAFDATFGAGFAERELRPALEGKSDLAPTGPVRPRARRFFGDLLFAAQALVSVLGP
jgi:aminopeptidase N